MNNSMKFFIAVISHLNTLISCITPDDQGCPRNNYLSIHLEDINEYFKGYADTGHETFYEHALHELQSLISKIESEGSHEGILDGLYMIRNACIKA